ncbi:E3 ubiquitin-protein ligase rnf213-alpha-like isoform X1 [Poecilia reticulata]|uniref:E3 ubiquitin-protein ligase rnf213-alpha-like isoform X1 n=1 Tax=Poecilia reticulata TaxID=8081 RepID=UPI0004A40A0F|nr:PREDICTED: E3 ubiquitin-protein ligase rnf213-alpha-like isoform X1 [Poecilia reticulata]XP_008404833.1 PREDICTED: E3 ubiquitin-protein ligase rnf213-alpha-like isoform X1 [Poecilia reticulata]XP_017160055.1 PREDICTED: E3 ubiquitin-protein ligase rnf213-alpha-like isoform X1 [Poecilia reticulata]
MNFCPGCGNRVDSSYRFCPSCGFKLYLLAQNRTQDASSSENQPAVTKENQDKDQDQVAQPEQEHQNEIQEKKAVDVSDSGLTRNNTPGTVLEDTRKTSSQNQAPHVVIPQIKGRCTEGTGAFPVATDGNDTQDSKETTGSNISVNPAEPLTPSGTNQTEKQSKECSSTTPEASEQTPQQQEVSKLSASEEDEDATVSKDRLSVGGTQDNGKQINKEHAGYKENQSALVGSYPDGGTIKDTESSPNVCSETKETDTLTQEQWIDSSTTRNVAKAEDQSDHMQQKLPKSAQEENRTGEDWVVVSHENKYQACSDKTSGSNHSVSMPHLSNTSGSNTQTEQPRTHPPVSSIVDHPDALQVHCDKSYDIVPKTLPKTASPLLPEESNITGSESAEQTANEGNQAEQPTNVENKDVVIAQEKQDTSVKPDDKKTPINNQMVSNQDGDQHIQTVDTNSRNNGKFVDLSPHTREKPKCTKVSEVPSDKTISSQMPRKPEQQPSIRDQGVSELSSPHSPPRNEDPGYPVPAKISKSTELPTSSNREYVHVYFHAVPSKDIDPENDRIFLMSEKLFGNWHTRSQEMSFFQNLGDKQYLVVADFLIPKDVIHLNFPYKYLIYKNGEKEKYEEIYNKEGNLLINRCLSIKEEYLSPEGSWHQYDDVIYLELKRHWPWDSLRSTVVKGRDQAGQEMLKIIFDLLTTWNKQNVENFFFLLQQFIYEYSFPSLHNGNKRLWELSYGEDQVKKMLRDFLNKIINKPCFHPLHTGVVALLVSNMHLQGFMATQCSTLCDLLCLPKMAQHHFEKFWKDFGDPLADKNSIADVVQRFCDYARQHTAKWVLVIPLIHLLKGESEPFQPVPPVFDPQFDPLRTVRQSKGSFPSDSSSKSLIKIIKDHAYLVNIDQLLVRSWMSLLHLEDLMDFLTKVQVELLDVLRYMQFSMKSNINHSSYMALKDLSLHLIRKECNHKQSFNDRYGECCLKTAVRLLGSVCRNIKEPDRCDVPLQFLELVCLISKIYGHTDSEVQKKTQEESFGETLQIITAWRRNTFNSKLFNPWVHLELSFPYEMNVWTNLLSMSFSHEEQTSFWRNTFLKDFEGKLKKEDRVNQIGLYSKMVEELSNTNPLLFIIEKCALEAVAHICQDKSNVSMKQLLETHNISKFGKLMSVVVLKSWPADSNGDHAEDEDLTFQYLLDWQMAKTVFQMAGAGEGLINKLSEEAQFKMTLGASVFKSVSEKFFSGQIKMKTLNQIFQREQNFLGLLKIDYFCDDGRCKDEVNMRRFLRLRKEEADAVSSEKEMIRDLLEFCQEVSKYVKVDFQGLDKNLQQNFDSKHLNEFMAVCSLDNFSLQTTRKVTYFNLSDTIYEMASELHDIKDSLIFKMCWTNQVRELSREHSDEEEEEKEEEETVYTLDLVHSKIFQSCYSQYKNLYDNIKSGELLLEEVDNIFEVYIGKYEDLCKDFDIMCKIDRTDNRKWISKRVAQIRQYHEHHLVMDSTEIIKNIKNVLCPEGNFNILEKLLQMNDDNSKTKNLNYIDSSFVRAKDILKDITDQRKECLYVLSQNENFIKWVKKELEDINELKVFVDLASISAGENDLDVDRVACFHDAVLGYSSLLYGLKQDSSFQNLMDSLPTLWKALENDKNLPKKLRDTARHLDWLKTVRETHGSVEFSSLSLATSINERGMYTIRAQNQKRLNLESSLKLQIQDGQGHSLTHNYEDLKELQNKLMLMSGKKQQNQTEVERFTEVFENVQRLAKAFIDLHTAGNPLFRCWEAKIYCKGQSDQCITMEINFCKTITIKINGSLVEQLVELSKKMELFICDWQKFMDKIRSYHYYLNFFTAEQIFHLCSVLSPANVNTEIDEQVLMMLSFIKPNCSASDVWEPWQRLSNRFEHGEVLNKNDDTFSVCFSRLTHEDAVENGDQTFGLRELEDLWRDYIGNDRMFFHDILDIRSLGHLLKMMADPEKDESEEPVLCENEDSSLRRVLPKGLIAKQPNLLICPHDQVLTSSICLYMNSEYEPLPSYDEVLLCTPSTSYEQVELFLRRCLTPGDVGQKVYTMIWADQLAYDVSCDMEKCFQRLSTHFNHNDYRLVIYCSSEREHTYVPTAFSQFKRDFVPQEPLGKIQQYLSRHFSPLSDLKDAMFKGGHTVGIVSSHRAGVGKSLYVQRLYEKLERYVGEGTAFKKCIRLTEHTIDDHQILQSLYDTPTQRDFKVFHLDVTSSVQKGLDEFLFKLFFLRYLMDSDGQMWHCTHKHLYIMELTETTNDQARCGTRLGQKENFAIPDVFPKVFCRPPKEVMALEKQKEENFSTDNDDPLMDVDCFGSEAFQRPYQYLTRFHNNENLDDFTYKGIEGSHSHCLQIFLFYCGVLDPSWAELCNFVWFLNLQLQACENSVFCNVEFVGDTLQGFKNFVVEFMILMSKDFATPSLCITDESLGKRQTDLTGVNENDLAPFLIRKRWEAEPHPYIFFNDDHTSMTFIGFHLRLNGRRGVDAINPSTGKVIKENIMTQELYRGLMHQRVPFNVDFDQLPRADKIEHLCSVLGIKWPTDPDETYELTTDNILKMMAIHMRFRCGIPVIIMGETGCGKTRLIKFMCELRRCGAAAENMKLVKVHGGTTSRIIHDKVIEAETLAKTNKENHEFDSVLFFDEANTTEAISSIKEIICDHSVQGKGLCSQTGLQIIAACNPYRKHTPEMIERLETSGLGYRVHAQETQEKLGSIPLRQLVYRVHVLPPSLMPLVWDFGQLSDSAEQMYIKQIVQRQAKANVIEERHIPMISKVLSSSQQFMREKKDECSFVSLRDVERCMQVFVWFHKNHSMFAEKLKGLIQQQTKRRNKPNFSPASDRVIWSLLMATGVCYQSCLENKDQYQKTISRLLTPEYKQQRIQQEIQLMQDLLLSGVPLGKTIARNEALKENFFMMVLCVELRIPLFIVGKPGSSKSLSKTLVADAMQGPTSHSDLFKRLKQIHLVSFQCSPHSTPEGIIHTFKQCARFQESKNLDEYISVVVLDEIGLAEDSPKMPLKTLHPLLEEGCVDEKPQPHQRVGFIGISNWALDPAKMNRGIFVSRGDLSETELIKSAEGICASERNILEKIKNLFQPFAKAYITVCKEGKGFFGLRDFYSLIKMIFSITKTSNECPTVDQIAGAVLRNFSGKDDVKVIDIFFRELRCDFSNTSISTIDMIKESIFPACQMEENRYLLILTKNYAALQILQQIFLSRQVHPEIIFGSSFPKDQEYMQICRNINRVKVCMETGQTVVLLNLQNLYESLYDALNQYYVTLGGQKYVDLGLGTHRVKCRVHPKFRLIVIEEKEVVYEQFPIPLINRLEKHCLDINTVLKMEQRDIAKQIQTWVNKFVTIELDYSTIQTYIPGDVFIGYHSDTCSSVILQVTEDKDLEPDDQVNLNKVTSVMLNCATPDSVVRLDKSQLPDDERDHLMKEYVKEDKHRSLGDYIAYHIKQFEHSQVSFTEVTTFSRLLTAADAEQLQNEIKCDAVKLLFLLQFETEYSFLKTIREFLDSARKNNVLIVQTEFDEDFQKRNILSSAKYSCINEIKKGLMKDDTKTFVYFVTKLPRMEGGTSYIGFQGGHWTSVHIDDLRRSREFVSDVHFLKNLRISDLFEDPPEAMETEDQFGQPQNDNIAVLGDVFDATDLVKTCVQTAVGMLRDVVDSGELGTRRVENLLTLLEESVFADLVRKHLHSLLKEYEANILSQPKDWVLNQASNVNALQEGGTFVHTLWRKIQAVVTPLLANLVSVIDKDCNLDLLLDEGEEMRNLWLHIFSSKEMLSVPYAKEINMLIVQSHNVGGNTMRCRMPFSWCIKDFLDELMMQAFRHQSNLCQYFHELFLNTSFGKYMAENVNERLKNDLFERYLHDFVSMTMKVASDDELELLCQALASCIDEVQRQKRDAEKPTLLHIHFAFYSYRQRLQNLSRIISLQPEIVLPLRRNQHRRNCPEMVLDVLAAKACVENLEPQNLHSDALCRQWMRQVKRLQVSMELIFSQHSLRQYGDRCKGELHPIGNGWKRIYILALFVEHLLLGFKNEDLQLKNLVLRHMKTLSTVLERNSDVKVAKPFEAVIENLKSCKQAALDQLFRFGVHCGVCMAEPEEPVDLPCRHMFCLTCIKESLDTGNTSCPTCRRDLPDGFQPCVSEEIRGSLKKNGNFRRRCNGFFIDLLSVVCFKDNKPPSKEVITHLLSYLRIETEHEQVQTKDLSPFDESPDKNPVVRSVILKLLLKFSFDEVQEYLQQHLSTVEDSRFVDEDDKSELYALYINCLEDAMWEKMSLGFNNAEELKFYEKETEFLGFCLREAASISETVSIQHLQYIAQLRMILTMAAQLISDKLSAKIGPDEANDFQNMVIRLCEDSGNDWYRVYLIRKISELQGVAQVQSLAKQTEFSWLFPEEIKKQNEDGGLMDQFLMYGDEYKTVRDAVAKALVDGDGDQIEEALEKCTATRRNITVFVLLALFREVSTLYRSPNASLHPTSETYKAFDDFIEGSDYLCDKEMRDFASALISNKLGGLSAQSDHTPADNVAIELAVHLAVILLTTNNDLLLPLKQLGLFPDNMQRAFIPTMPDDMVAIAQAAIQQDYGELTWYVCCNNHLCFVDECGLPMERGKCLECGEEVGGENHAALQGFTPVQLQQDHTRPGHILGDPERRNNPDALDTKNMSLTPFMLVRLVTHLAMLLGTSKNCESVQQIIHPPVEDVVLFLSQHIMKDLEQLTQALAKGADDAVTTTHLILKSLQEPVQTNNQNIDAQLSTKASRNTWETSVAADIMTPKLKILDQLLQEAKGHITNDSRVSSNFILRITFGDDCKFLTSLQQTSEVHSSSVWSCRERLSLLSLTHIIQYRDLKEELPLLWKFMQKETEYRQIMFLPDIVTLQNRLVKKYQNASEQIDGSISDFLQNQKGSQMRSWYEKHIKIFLQTWNLLRVHVTTNELKIPEEFCSTDLDLSSPLQYLLPRRQGPGLCATGLVSYLVTLQNELVNAVHRHSGEEPSYKVAIADLMDEHVISYDVEKDLLPLVLSNCQYSLQRGQETISEYDLPRIQQQILTRFLQEKPLITRTGIPTLINAQGKDYESIFKAIKGKIPQVLPTKMTRNRISRELDSLSDVCEALKIVDLLLGFLSMTGGDPSMPLVTYLHDKLKMDQNIDEHILKALRKCNLEHCVFLWQLLSSLKSENLLPLKRDPFFEHPKEYKELLTEENKAELKGFMSRGNAGQWLLEMHEFILLVLSRPHVTDRYNPEWSVKESMQIYMDEKKEEIPQYVEENFHENLQLSQVLEAWKYVVTSKQEWMKEG